MVRSTLRWVRLLMVIVGTITGFAYAGQQDQGTKIDSTTKAQVDVGVLAIRGHLYAQQRWQPTIDWLNQQIPAVHFVLHPLDLDGMAQSVREQRMDFVLTNPGQAVQLGRQYPLSWIATIVNQAPERSNYGIGSALVVRSASLYKTPSDVAGLPIAAVSKDAFGGYLTMRYQVLTDGGDPNSFFSDVRYLGFPIDANLYQLRDKAVEAAVVPACLLEQMEKEGLIDKGLLRVLNPLEQTHSSCAVSTPLYPNWSFAKTERGSSQLAKEISRALLAMPADSLAAIASKASGWTSPVSLLSIDKLFQAMDLHPLQQPWWKEAIRWLRLHQEWAWTLFLFVIVLNAYHFWLEYRFSKSKHDLEQTLLRLKEKSEMLEHTQRVAIIGELGSSLAHEINQPLAAIRNYSEGGLLRLAKKRPPEDIVPVLEKIQDQVERADAIISRLRDLIKKRTIAKTECDVEQLLGDSIELLKYRLDKNGIETVRSTEGQQRLVNVDAVGIQQVLVNVINNAIEACSKLAEKQRDYKGTIALHTEYQSQMLSIRIADNGTGLEQDNPTQAFISSKKDGLGLGLAICRDVVEMHNGELQIQSTQPHGCLVMITLPYHLPADTMLTDE
ncbi:PhnD/SsuA/transferrin family substrate-binding protein [Vibrio barjaei]|uniref:histidine kinase n=1 Tax=Vibrio barjaei TaxID=1676683 RepID=A0ABW7IMJ6_9VIBR